MILVYIFILQTWIARAHSQFKRCNFLTNSVISPNRWQSNNVHTILYFHRKSNSHTYNHYSLYLFVYSAICSLAKWTWIRFLCEIHYYCHVEHAMKIQKCMNTAFACNRSEKMTEKLASFDLAVIFLKRNGKLQIFTYVIRYVLHT